MLDALLAHMSSLAPPTPSSYAAVLVAALASLWERARYAWALATATWRVSVVQRFLIGSPYTLLKVVALDEDGGRDATVTAAFEPARWEDSVRAFTGWATQKLRVEVRYLSFGHKYRAVLRPGDAFVEPEGVERHRGGPKGVLAAELVGAEGLAVDVTRRVHKYQGPAKDFHAGKGLRVGVLDMFPLDDPRELGDHFHTLRLVDARARVVEVPTDCPDVGAALAKTE